MKRGRRGGNRGGDYLFGMRRRVLGTVVVMMFTAGAAMGMVWLNIQSTSTMLRFERARQDNENLRSDLNSNRLKLLNKIRLSDLDPAARERLGMKETSVSDMLLVRFHPSLEGDAVPMAGLIDHIAPQASASTDWTVSGSRRGSRVEGRR